MRRMCLGSVGGGGPDCRDASRPMGAVTVPARICITRQAAWTAGVLIVILTLLAQTARLAQPDITYFLYSAAQLLAGARLYRDVVDMNPPAIFVFNIPIVWLAHAIHLSDIRVFDLATVSVLGGVLLFVRRLLRRYLLPFRETERRYVLLLLCLVLFPLVGEDFGQREHFVLALLLPYVAVVIAGLDRQRVARLDATAAGVLAGLALAIKPPFAMAWLAVELWRRWSGRAAEWRRMTPEVWGVVSVTVGYIVAVITLLPEYLRLVLLLGGPFTSYLHRSPLALLVAAPGAVFTAFAALAVIAVRGAGEGGRARSLLAAAMLGSFLAAVAQQKDLRYHFYPAYAFAALVLGLVAVQRVSLPGVAGQVYGRIAKAVVATVALVVLTSTLLDALGGTAADRRQRAQFRQLVAFVQAHSGGEPIAVLSYNMGSAFPLVSYAHVQLASRFACLWILPGTYWDALLNPTPIRYNTPTEMRPAERLFTRAVHEDLLRARPRLLLILRPLPDELSSGFRRLNYVAYFGRDSSLSTFFNGYQLTAADGAYDLYERVDAGMTRSGPPPSAAVQAFAPPTAPDRGSRSVDPKLIAAAVVYLTFVLGALARERWSRKRLLAKSPE